uniref:Uncharacterized protein n=1 Tax=Pan troglodytes TaxID=9598 RepID=G2HFB7_PANTR|nr:hypothetical protein [Pan troglodytes]
MLILGWGGGGASSYVRNLTEITMLEEAQVNHMETLYRGSCSKNPQLIQPSQPRGCSQALNPSDIHSATY